MALEQRTRETARVCADGRTDEAFFREDLNQRHRVFVYPLVSRERNAESPNDTNLAAIYRVETRS